MCQFLSSAGNLGLNMKDVCVFLSRFIINGGTALSCQTRGAIALSRGRIMNSLCYRNSNVHFIFRITQNNDYNKYKKIGTILYFEPAEEFIIA